LPNLPIADCRAQSERREYKLQLQIADALQISEHHCGLLQLQMQMMGGAPCNKLWALRGRTIA
jgi:hypothetical protein